MKPAEIQSQMSHFFHVFPWFQQILPDFPIQNPADTQPTCTQNDPTAGALEFDRDLDKEIDDVLRDVLHLVSCDDSLVRQEIIVVHKS